ncbi:MAG TPA: Ig-like domain repeat protein, partial [Mycobacteriales bacterium]|nr:Ig-like domain repeat protein [Mycobacteriales bacterium]
SAAASAPGCGASFEQGAVVTLTATPDANSTFTSWGNVTCQNSDSNTTGICQVLNTSGANVSVTFTHDPITVSYKADAGAGTGTIDTATAKGVAYKCTFHCTLSYAYHYGPGYNIQAYAQPDPNMKFVRWNGPGCSTAQTCLINPWDQNLTYTAEFEPITQTLSVQMRTNDSGTGSGSFLISSLTGTTTCTTSCTVTVDQGDTVSLTALNGATGTFNRWVTSGGTCSGNTCSIPVGFGTVNAAVYFDGVPQSLSVNTAGVGSGSVTSSIGGINCGANCSLTLPYGYTVTLHALPSAGSVFTGWSGDVGSCDTSQSCVIPFTETRNVAATFGLAPETLTVTTDGNGAGSVSSDVGGIDCGSSCTAPIAANDDVTLTAAPDATSSTFTGWSGDIGACSDSSPTCVVTMDQARTIDANFTLIPRHLTLTTDGTGTGTISSDPSGIDCGTTCSADYDHGTTVTLTATPDAGSGFAGWTGDCSGTDPCTVTLDAAKSVGATFTLLPLHTLAVTRAGNGSGTVNTDDATIDCGPGSSPCSHDYPSDAVVTLHAVPTDVKSIFTGWSGACSGTDDSCQVALDQVRAVTATFALVSVPSTTALTLSTASRAYGGSSTAKVTVTGGSDPVSGQVSLFDGKTVIGRGSLAAGSVTIAIPKTLAVGVHTLSAKYAGAIPLMASTSAAKPLAVVKAPSTVTGKLAKSTVTTKVKPKVVVTVTTSAGVASGTVTIKRGSKVIGHGTLKNGKITVTLATLKAGKYKLTVVYGGSATSSAATSKVITLTVKKT